jgi:hypothetical protein
MSLIDKTYFKLDVNVPINTYQVLTDMITRHEPEVLRKALGPTLYELVAAYSDTSDQRIKDIVDGKEYTVSYGGYEHTVKWAGLANSEKVSLIAYYVYFYWQRAHSTLTIYTGEIQPMNENSSAASIGMKVSMAWAMLRELYGFRGQSPLSPSLYNFLIEHESDYPEWAFRDVGFINCFDL